MSIEEEKDAVGRELGLGIVGSKGRRLSNGKRTKDDCEEDAEDIAERLIEEVIGGKVHQEGTESKHNGKEKEDDSLGEGISESIDRRVEGHCKPVYW